MVVATYSEERYADLGRAIESLDAQILRPFEVIVAVDRNDDLLRQIGQNFPELTAVANTRHAGAGGARNSGVAAASGDWVAFIDDDCIADPDWLAKLMPALTGEHVLGGGGSIRPLWQSQRPRWFPAEFDWVVGCTYRGLPERTTAVRNVIAANMAVRRDVFDQLGGFLPDFGKQGAVSEPEETELCIRALERWPDRQWLYVPNAGVQHRVTRERETWRYFVARCRNEGRGKARMSARTRSTESLSSERHYATRTLPAGMLRGVGSGLRGQADGFTQAAAILAGLTVTGAAYGLDASRLRQVQRRSRDSTLLKSAPERSAVAGEASSPEAGSRGTSGHTPITVLDLDLSEPFPSFPDLVAAGEIANHAWLVVRLSGEPLGIERVDSETLCTPNRLAGVLRRSWAAEAAARGTSLDGEPPLPLATGPTSFAGEHARYLAVARPVSVVVGTHERPDDLARCLEGLVQQDHPRFTVWVVDNAPRTEATRQVVSSFEGRLSVKYLLEPVAGASRARNRALAQEDLDDFVAMIDDDEVADPLWLSELTRTLEADNAVDAVSGIVVPGELETDAQAWFEELGGHTGRGFRRTEFSPATRGSFNPLYPQPTFGVSGNCVFRTESIRAVGGFDPALGPGTRTCGGEDMAVFTDILRRQGTVLYIPTALTRHYHRRDLDGLYSQIRGYGIGITAFYTALAINNPRVIPELLRLVPYGVRHMASSEPEEPEIKSSLPQGLTRAKLRGMLQGPGAYLRERMARRP